MLVSHVDYPQVGSDTICQMSLGDSNVAIEASHRQSPMFELMMVFLIEARVEIQMLCW